MVQVFLRFVGTLFIIFEKRISKKLGQVFIRFLITLFFIFGKGGKREIGQGFFYDLSLCFLKIF